MIKPKLNKNPLILSPGHFYEQYWDNAEVATQNVRNWEYNCIYQLKPNGLRGQRQVLDLNSMQINHVGRLGGLMLTPCASKNSFVIMVLALCADKACLGPMKLRTGDIVFFDDSDAHNFINNGAIEFTAVTIKKSRLGTLLATLTKIINHHIYDTDSRFRSTLYEILKRFSDSSGQKKDTQSFQEAEDEILQTASTPSR